MPNSKGPSLFQALALLPRLYRWALGGVTAFSMLVGGASIAQGSAPVGTPCTVASDCASAACSPEGLCVELAASPESVGNASNPGFPAAGVGVGAGAVPAVNTTFGPGRAIPVTAEDVGVLNGLLAFFKQGGLIALCIMLLVIIAFLAREYARARDAQMETFVKTRDDEKKSLAELTQILVQSATTQAQVAEAMEQISATVKAVEAAQRETSAKMLRALDRLALRMEGRKIVHDDEDETAGPKA